MLVHCKTTQFNKFNTAYVEYHTYIFHSNPKKNITRILFNSSTGRGKSLFPPQNNILRHWLSLYVSLFAYL